MYCSLCKMTLPENVGHACTITSVPVQLSNPLDPLSASCEIESLREKLKDKALEIRLLHTAIDKSNEALEEAIKTKEERDRLLLQIDGLREIVRRMIPSYAPQTVDQNAAYQAVIGGADYRKLQEFIEKRKYDSNEHAHTCTQLGAYDCPHCGNCPDCGGKRKDALPGMEKALAEKAHQTEQAAHKPNECQHPPMEMCPNCDLI